MKHSTLAIMILKDIHLEVWAEDTKCVCLGRRVETEVIWQKVVLI